MFDLVPISLLVTALGGVIYVVSNHLSEFEQNGEETKPEFSFRAKFVDWVNQLPLDEVKEQSLSVAQKILHKTRVLLLKTDNHLMELIGKISEGKKTSEENKKASDNSVEFWKGLSDYKQDISGVQIPESKSEAKIDLALNGNLEKKFFDIKPAAVKNVKAKKSSKKLPG